MITCHSCQSMYNSNTYLSPSHNWSQTWKQIPTVRDIHPSMTTTSGVESSSEIVPSQERTAATQIRKFVGNKIYIRSLFSLSLIFSFEETTGILGCLPIFSSSPVHGNSSSNSNTKPRIYVVQTNWTTEKEYTVPNNVCQCKNVEDVHWVISFYSLFKNIWKFFTDIGSSMYLKYRPQFICSKQIGTYSSCL